MRQRICGRCLLWLGPVWARGLRRAGLWCARRTRGRRRRVQSRRLSWSVCGLTWPFWSGWCPGGRQSRLRPEPSADGGDAGQGRDLRGSGTGGKKRGPGARARRRDYSHLPRVEVAWDFGGRVLLPGVRDAVHGPGQRSCGGAAGLAGDRAGAGGLPAPVPAALLLPGPGDGDGARPVGGDRHGPFTNAFIAMLFAERFAVGRSMNSLVTGLGRHGAVVPVVASARRRDDRAGLRAARRGRHGQVVAAG